MTSCPQPPPQGAFVEAHDDVFPRPTIPRTRSDESRRFPRFEVRAEIEATIHPRYPGSGQEPELCNVMMRDLSRGGMNILHVDQLFPGQRIDVVLHNGSCRAVEVMWCKRLAHRCYTIGCRFVKAESAAKETGDRRQGTEGNDQP